MLLDSVESNKPIASYSYTIGEEDHTLDTWGRPREPWQRLSRMSLPWTAPTATDAVQSVTRALAYDDRAATLALRGAKQVCESGQADLALLDALTSYIARLDSGIDHGQGVTATSILARRVLVSATPPDLLDLSLLVDGDAWAAPAREAAHAAHPHEVADLVRLLGELGARRPSQSWLTKVDQALAPPAAKLLLRQWLEVAAYTDIVPEWPGSQIGECLGTLFVGTNTDVVRAAVWATCQLPDEDWPAALLGILARRGSAHNGAAGFPEALALKVASAAVDTLIARNGKVDRVVLAELLEDLQRRDLVKKVGVALGRVGEATERDAELRRTKAHEVRRKASPAPRKARAAIDSLIRQRFGADLRAHGFKGGPRTWRRPHEDRVDLICVDTFTDGASQTRLRVGYGSRYDAVHSADGTWFVERSKTAERHLDIQISEISHHRDPLGEDALAATARRLAEVVVPFLDTLGRYEFAKAVLEHDVGVPTDAFIEAGPVGSPARSKVLGLLALSARDKATAMKHLPRARTWELSLRQEDAPLNVESREMVAFWSDTLERAAKLP